MLPDPKEFANTADVSRVIFCTGKVFYDLVAYRQEKGIENAAIIRIEQLYPFHRQMVEAIVGQYPNASHFVWCQEEPLNMGAWSYIWPRLDRAVGAKSATPAATPPPAPPPVPRRCITASKKRCSNTLSPSDSAPLSLTFSNTIPP